MHNFELISGFVGGMGLFLLGMSMMTDGLKLAAGPALESVLAWSTRTRTRGLLSGALVTALVQSSSAVTVATIGFVNAGIVGLSQAIWVLFGANVGTTMTGWLVALVGLKFEIEALALPLLGCGMLLRLTGERKRRGAFGMALAGFGILFLGIDLLRVTFIDVAAGIEMPTGTGLRGLLVHLLTGIALTVLMQSSSAALTLALTAAQSGLVSLETAAAMVIGANVGTTVTALLATIGATANARRAAAAHIVFNVWTAAFALAVLPWLVKLLGTLGAASGIGAAPAAMLALFRTIFNVLGVVLIWPIAGHLSRFLERRFRRAGEDEALPRHIDNTIIAVPALALGALEREVAHIGDIALRALEIALRDAPDTADIVRNDHRITMRLNRAVADFIVQFNRAGMSADSAARLPRILRVARYYERTAEFVVEAIETADELPRVQQEQPAALTAFVTCAELLVTAIHSARTDARIAVPEAAVLAVEEAYEHLKEHWLAAGTDGRLSVTALDARLRAASALRRALQQVYKATLMEADWRVDTFDAE